MGAQDVAVVLVGAALTGFLVRYFLRLAVAVEETSEHPLAGAME